MISKIQAYQTSDGKLFDKQADAEAHDDVLSFAPRINAFFASGTAPYAQGTYAAMTTKVIVAW
jgi:hypothetical protein